MICNNSNVSSIYSTYCCGGKFINGKRDEDIVIGSAERKDNK